MLIKILYDFLIFCYLLALIPDPVMHFTPRTSFRGIEDVENILKFGYRKLLNPNFFHIIVLKDPKGYKYIYKKIFELI